MNIQYVNVVIVIVDDEISIIMDASYRGRYQREKQVMQMEICAIKEAGVLIKHNDNLLEDVNIYSDSQIAIACIASKVVRTQVVMSCWGALS